MKIVFFASSSFAKEPLASLYNSRHELLGVVTQPDRPGGRGHLPVETDVKKEAKVLGLPVFQPRDVNDAAFVRRMDGMSADLFVVIAFGEILKGPLLRIPPKGCVNLHASLLPRYRGAAPINRALISGEAKSGISVIRMNEKMDAGDIIAQRECDITDDDTAVSYGLKLSRIGADLLVAVLDSIEDGRAEYVPQDTAYVSYAPKLTKKDGLIDWNKTAHEICDRVRGLKPWPGTYTYLSGKMLKIIEVEKVNCDGTVAQSAGCIIRADEDNGMVVYTGEGALRLKTMQPEGKRPMSSQEFMRGHRIKTGMVLGQRS